MITECFPRTLSALATLWLAALLCLWSGISLAGQLTTHYTYDEAGNKTSQTDAQGRVTRWGYTLTNQVASRTLPDGKTEYFTYDDLGNLSTHTDFAGQITRYAYDELDRPTTVAHPDGRSVKTTYTKTGQVETVTETRTVNGKKVSLITRYAYDINDRLLKVTNPDNRFISYGYDLAGNVTSRSTVNGTTGYEYDGMNRLSKVTDSQGGVTTYSYDPAGRLLTTTYPNGTDGLREYDDNGHLLQVSWRQTATGQVVTATRYTLLPNGMRATLTRFDGQSSLQVTSVPGANGQSQAHWELGNPATDIDYTYDSLQRLTGEHQVSHRQDSPFQELTNRWTYDSTGNRLTQEHTVLGWSGISSVETTSYSYDSRDRLLSSTMVSNTGSSVTTTYDWDDNGRLVRKASPGEVTLYGWRSDDRLLTVKRGATDATAVLVAAYDYDAKGNRTRKIIGSNRRIDYITDVLFSYPETLEEIDEDSSNAGISITRYERGLALLSKDRKGHVGQDAVKSYYHQDGLGSVIALTDSYGGVLQGLNSSAFLSLESVVGGDYGYAGEYFDAEALSQYNRARWLDASGMFFLTLDKWPAVSSIPMSLNGYLYAGANGVNNIDPSGNFFTIASLTMTEFEEGYGKGKEAQERYNNYKTLVGSLCKTASKVAKTADHHALPKFAGGMEKATEYASIPVEVHQTLHTLLSYALVINGFPGPNKSKYMSIMSGDAFEKGKVIAVIRDVSAFIDKTCIGYPGFQEVSPVLERVISSMDYVF